MLLTDLTLKELEILEDLTDWRVREHWRLHARLAQKLSRFVAKI